MNPAIATAKALALAFILRTARTERLPATLNRLKTQLLQLQQHTPDHIALQLNHTSLARTTTGTRLLQLVGETIQLGQRQLRGKGLQRRNRFTATPGLLTPHLDTPAPARGGSTCWSRTLRLRSGSRPGAGSPPLSSAPRGYSPTSRHHPWPLCLSHAGSYLVRSLRVVQPSQRLHVAAPG